MLSVWQRLIELEGTARSVVRNGFRIGGVEPAGLIELEDALGRRPSGRQWRPPPVTAARVPPQTELGFGVRSRLGVTAEHLRVGHRDAA